MIKKKTPIKKNIKSPTTAPKSASKAAQKTPDQKGLVKKKTQPVTKKQVSTNKKTPVTKTIPAKKVTPAQQATPAKKVVRTIKSKVLSENRGALRQTFITQPASKKHQHLSQFLEKQRARLLQLKDTLLDSMKGVARDNLHTGSDTSAFGMHQADAGSDAYDRDFALSILSQEQNSLYEIDEALKRIDDGAYGVCEISNKQIPRARLEARPFTRYTVECQAEIEKRQHVVGNRLPVSALFGLTEEESENEEEENLLEPIKD